MELEKLVLKMNFRKVKNNKEIFFLSHSKEHKGPTIIVTVSAVTAMLTAPC